MREDRGSMRPRASEALKEELSKKLPYWSSPAIYVKKVGGSHSPSVKNTFKVQLSLEVTVKMLLFSCSCSFILALLKKKNVYCG